MPKLKSAKVEIIKKNYPITSSEMEEFNQIETNPELKAAYLKELAFI